MVIIFKKTVSLLLAMITIVSCFTFSSVSAKKVSVQKVKDFLVTENLTDVTLSWKRDKNATGYVISRTNDKSWKRYVKITNNKTVSFVDEDVCENELYYYSIRAYKKQDGKNYYGETLDVVPVFFGTNFYIKTFSNSVELNWTQVNGADGYQIFWSTNRAKFKRMKTLGNAQSITFTKTNLDTKKNNYSFYLKAYKKKGTKKQYLYQSETLVSSDLMSYVNAGVSAPKTKFTTQNVQGKKATTTTSNITKNDRNIINGFNALSYTTDMSPYYRIRHTFMYIHNEVDYATTSAQYSAISGATYTSAIFEKQIGQCAQYNGAMVTYLARLGFNTKLIHGYRGTSNSNKWQHFWGEVKLNGVTYVIETGNQGKDGSWNYFFTPYKNTKKYLKCGKYVSGIKA